MVMRILVTLSAKMSETVTPLEFNVEGEQGSEADIAQLWQHRRRGGARFPAALPFVLAFDTAFSLAASPRSRTFPLPACPEGASAYEGSRAQGLGIGRRRPADAGREAAIPCRAILVQVWSK
jgi:hypothetical protein